MEPLQWLPVQRQLSVGAADDPLEKEADDMAGRVMRMPEPSFIQRKCTHCEAEEKAQRKPLASFIQKKGNEGGVLASTTVSNQIQSGKGGGSIMEAPTQSFMESRFGADFSSVRIHTDHSAIQLSRELNAQAFTVGNDIYFNSGKYAPEASDGKHLLAHELTHVIQQSGSGNTAHIAPRIQRQIAPGGVPVTAQQIIQRTPEHFIPEVVAAQLREAMEGWGTDEDAIYAALGGRTQAEVDAIAMAYQRLTRRNLQADLTDELTEGELRRLAGVSTPGATTPEAQAAVIADQLRNAMEGLGTNEEAVYAALSGRTPEMMAAIRVAYQQQTHRSLMDDLRDDLTDSEYARAMLLMNGNSLAQLLPYIGDDGISIGTTAIESSDEYRTLMDPQQPWQQNYQVTADEARLVSLLILNHLRNGGRFSWQNDGANFIQSARQRLQHTAISQQSHTDRLGVEIGVVTVQESIQLFNQLSQLTFFTETGTETPVTFHYPANACYTRAYFMEQRLTALGYASRKEFVISKQPGGLTVRSNYSNDTIAPGMPATTNWWYHVAPVISVQQPNGTVVQMVMDPSLDNHPITITEWTAKMRPVNDFRPMTLEEVRDYVSGNGGSFSGIGNITYEADRDSYFVGDWRNAPAGAAALMDMRNKLHEVSTYATAVPAQELAFFIRNTLSAAPVNVQALIQRISSTPLAVRNDFISRFPNLITDIYNRLSVSESLQIITAFTTP